MLRKARGSFWLEIPAATKLRFQACRGGKIVKGSQKAGGDLKPMMSIGLLALARSKTGITVIDQEDGTHIYIYVYIYTFNIHILNVAEGLQKPTCANHHKLNDALGHGRMPTGRAEGCLVSQVVRV